ncbi:MAG: phage major capsid protein [Lachnospiraceae bacterium]|nr:phage major capsid protein [Lachnospiraceae bacterium]
MASVLSMGTDFPAEVSSKIFNLVRGKSSLAKMAPEEPIAFTGTDVFTFNYDNEVSVVGENAAKENGGLTVEPVTIKPVKIEYGARVSDEFMHASDEKKLEIMQAFIEGFARKAARGLDIMAMHGYNPKAGTASQVIGNNHLDYKSQEVVQAQGNLDLAIPTALTQLGDFEVSGVVMSRVAANTLASLTADNAPLYPELKWGGQPETLNGLRCDVNTTVSKNAKVAGYVGDWEAFRWGYARDIEIKVIEYGNPDNDANAGDLAGHNQVYLRGEAYIGWGILSDEAFARIVTEAL